jgi:hypothetical protein
VRQALAQWYAAHPAIRRLWAVMDLQGLRIIVTLGPTHDGDDILPAWLANGREWTDQLQVHVEGPVQLEVTHEPFLPDLSAGDGVLVAQLCWRDPGTAD